METEDPGKKMNYDPRARLKILDPIVMERQCRICGQWKIRKGNFPKDKKKERSLWCYPCKAEYSCLNSAAGLEVARKFVKDSQANWDYVFKYPNLDRVMM